MPEQDDWKASTHNSLENQTFLYHLDSNYIPTSTAVAAAGTVNVEWKAVKEQEVAHLPLSKVQPPGYQSRVSTDFSQTRYKRFPRFSVHIAGENPKHRNKQDFQLSIVKSKLNSEKQLVPLDPPKHLSRAQDQGVSVQMLPSVRESDSNMVCTQTTERDLGPASRRGGQYYAERRGEKQRNFIRKFARVGRKEHASFDSRKEGSQQGRG